VAPAVSAATPRGSARGTCAEARARRMHAAGRSSGVPKEGHEAEIHVQLLVTVKEPEHAAIDGKERVAPPRNPWHVLRSARRRRRRARAAAATREPVPVHELRCFGVERAGAGGGLGPRPAGPALQGVLVPVSAAQEPSVRKSRRVSGIIDLRRRGGLCTLIAYDCVPRRRRYAQDFATGQTLHFGFSRLHSTCPCCCSSR